MTAWINPPALTKGKCFEIYRKEILAWGELTDLPKYKQGIVVALSLPEDVETHIRERVFDQIPLQDLKTDDGLIILLNFLDKHCGKDELVDSLEKYEDFESFEREDGQSIQNFISVFDLKYKKIEQKNMKLAPEVLAFRLLKKANLTRTEKLLILTGMDFENKPALYEQAKKALIKFKDCFSISTASNCEEKSFSQFKREKSRNRQGKDNQRPIKANGVVRKKINPSGADGKILKCLSCGSFRHLLDDCPDSWENMDIKKNMGNEHRKVLCHSDRAISDGSRVWEEATNKSGVTEELKTVVTGLKEEIVSLKREIKQIKIGKKRKIDGMGECFNLQSEEQEGEMCLSSVLGKLSGEMKNLKSEVKHLKDEIMKMKAGKDRELGKQVECRMRNESMPDNNRNKSRENENDRSEIKIESIYGGLGTEMMDKKLNSNIGFESEIKAIQIKENCEANQSKESQVRKDSRKEAGVKENGWDRKHEWNIVCSTYKRKYLEANSKAWHKHVIASTHKRDAEKHQRIISLLTVIQIKLSDYMRQYVWDTELSATEIASWKQLTFLQYNIAACYL